MHILNKKFFILAACCLAVPLIAIGCGGGSDYVVGDCLSDQVNEDGEAQKVSCDSEDSFTVEELARNGGQPDCGYDRQYISESGLIATIQDQYITDAVSGTSYCGPANFDPYGKPFPAESEE
jgi:hypothetical protein